MQRYDQLLYWVKERYNIFLKKEGGLCPPWTSDPILQNYRFCNVHRENDKVTKWIHLEWCKRHHNDPDMWFAILIARLLNLPSTLQELGYMSQWDRKQFTRVLLRRKAAGQANYNGAYMITTHKHKMDKTEYYAWRLGDIYEDRENIRPRSLDTLQHFYDRLISHDGFSSFMVSQVIADIKYYNPLYHAKDWHTFAEPGPGSLRGMRRLYGLETDDTSEDKLWKLRLSEYRGQLNDDLYKLNINSVCAQNAQNILCEFDKYMRALLGEGRPKQRYSPR